MWFQPIVVRSYERDRSWGYFSKNQLLVHLNFSSSSSVESARLRLQSPVSAIAVCHFQVYAWGDNDHGQQGNSTTTVNRSPGPVETLCGLNITGIACGSSHRYDRFEFFSTISIHQQNKLFQYRVVCYRRSARAFWADAIFRIERFSRTVLLSCGKLWYQRTNSKAQLARYIRLVEHCRVLFRLIVSYFV